MIYENIIPATFLRRPNRFLAEAVLDGGDGRPVICHVKNTGRLKELLIPGCRVLLMFHPNAAAEGRKTSYSLIAVWKENALGQGKRILVNIDSQAPNLMAWEWVSGGGLCRGIPSLPQVSELRREVVFGSSRFDLAFKEGGKQAFMEVKGVTLERDGIAMFPDAPTERGVRHLKELALAAEKGYSAYILFILQHEGLSGFTPNTGTHPEFADALWEAQAAGVRVMALECRVDYVAAAGRLSVNAALPVKIIHPEEDHGSAPAKAGTPPLPHEETAEFQSLKTESEAAIHHGK